MGHRNREIETKYLVRGADLSWVCNELDRLLRTESPIRRWGNSTDTYWSAGPNKFARVRERDGIRQLTVKVKDKGSNDNRVEIDLDCTSKVSDIHQFFAALLDSPSSGHITKSYYVWEMAASEHDTITAYTVEGHENLKDTVVLEFEARTLAGVSRLEKLVLDSLQGRDNIKVERAPGSLYEMCILKG